MKNFSFVLLFAIMIATTLNSCVEKCSRDNQVIGEECFCIKDDKGNFVDLHYVKKKDGIVSFTAEPSSIKPNEDTTPNCITIFSNMIIKHSENQGTMCINSTDKEKLWIFEATLGEPNFCKSRSHDGNDNEPTESVSFKCRCYGGAADACKGNHQIRVSPDGNSSYMAVWCDKVGDCSVSGADHPCNIYDTEGKKPFNPNNATLLIVAAKAIEYNGLKYE